MLQTLKQEPSASKTIASRRRIQIKVCWLLLNINKSFIPFDSPCFFSNLFKLLNYLISKSHNFRGKLLYKYNKLNSFICSDRFYADSKTSNKSLRKLRIIAIVIIWLFCVLWISISTSWIIYKWIMLRRKRNALVSQSSAVYINQEIDRFDNVQNLYNIRTCAICLEEFKENSDVVEIHSCRHIFHKECMQNFVNIRFSFSSAKRCPLWKSELKPALLNN